MHPASSIIVFSTLNGAGFGLLGLVCLGMGPYSNPAYLWSASIFGFAMAVGGLLASTFHLGHPERAWRALTQWRSSWLSREGALAVITLAVMGTYFYLLLFHGVRMEFIGTLGALLAVCTVYSTAMIYAQLKSVPRWNTAFTPAVFLACAISTGLLPLVFLIGYFDSVSSIFRFLIMIFLGLSWIMIIAYWDNFKKSVDGSAKFAPSPESATGLGRHDNVRLLESPHSSPNYLMREMVYRIGRKHAKKLRLLAVSIGGVIPFLLTVVAIFDVSIYLTIAPAFVLHFFGIVLSRWLFFAEAEHVVSLYYGHRLDSAESE